MAGPGVFTRTYKHIRRYQQIIGVLVKYGFEDMIGTIRIRKHLPFTKRVRKKQPSKEISERTRWERMRLVLEELGTTFIKFGQVMSNRPDLLPQPLIRELEKLQDDVPAFDYEKLEQIVEEELDGETDQYFQSIEKAPFAAASIAQVHKATLQSGEKVVIKVQRPNIREQIETDIEIMYNLAELMENYASGLAIFHPTDMVRQFEKTIKKEMNFKLEMANINRFREDFESEKHIYVPQTYPDYCTKRLITMEFVEGIKVSHIDDLKEKGYDTKLIAQRGADLFMQQVFLNGFFHADPHPGNILILADNQLCFLDFGMMGILLDKDRLQLGSMIIGIQMQDPDRIIRALQKLSTSSEIKNKKKLAYELNQLIADYQSQSIGDINISDIMQQLRDIINHHNIEVPPDFILLIKAISTMEGVGLMLDPEFNTFEILQPYVKKLMRERFSPTRLLKRFYIWMMDSTTFLEELPYELKEVLNKLKAGKINIEIEHTGIQPMLTTLDRVSNRIAFSIILASLIIGSSLIVLSDIPPKWNSIPTIGLAGFTVAGLMGVWLLIVILRRGRF